MFRRKLGVVTAILLLTPVFIILMMSNPDLSGEQFLIESIADLRQRLQHAEMLNRDRISDVLFLSNQFKTIIENGNSSNQVSLSEEAKKLLENLTLNTDLHLPSIYSYMPHLLKSFDATTPAFKMSKGRTSVDIVLGIPTVKREVQSYLMTTLKNLVDSMSESERLRCLIVVLVAEPDIDYVTMVGSQVGRKFSEHVESGLIEIISPPASFFPDFSKLKQTLGDTMERVRWRTKQNLDYSFLMMYSQPKGIYYVQLEDDIQTKKGFIHTMTNFALRKSTENKNWIVLDFCQLGFIGKMFKCAELPYLIQFFVMFYNDKPVDWLLDYMIQTKVCNLDKDVKNCKKAKESVWIHYKPSIFQHIGTHSSLKGKVQKLKDKQYGKVQLHFPHANPPARAESDIKHYKQHSFERAYGGETYFWGLLPQVGDRLRIHFTPPVPLTRYLFRSGNLEHPSDRFYNTTVEVLPVSPLAEKLKLNMTKDNFIIMGSFDDMGLAEGNIDPLLGPIKTLRLTVHVESENWAILSEIMVEAAER